ncbi:hypothetical protein RUM44_005313 [Polyplax serrata]|uniref:Uncharacterized protein n=1 Tax=Polyplax serrata TaxID=468196 RepID=A0ABR1AD62_POLSC
MPKIFLIKNRLEQQQLRLSQGYKGDSNESLTPPGSPLSDVAPLALIVRSQTEEEMLSTNDFEIGSDQVPWWSTGPRSTHGTLGPEEGFPLSALSWHLCYLQT